MSTDPTKLTESLNSESATLDNSQVGKTREKYKNVGSVDVNDIMNKLQDDVLIIRWALDEIHKATGLLDGQNCRKRKPDDSSDGDYIPKFQPELDFVRRELDELLWRSRDIASAEANHAGDYRTVMIPVLSDKDEPLEAKKEKLGNFIEEIWGMSRLAEELSNGFLNIPIRIQDIQTGLNRAMTDAQPNLSRKVLLLCKEIEWLKEEIQTYENSLKEKAEFEERAVVATGAGAGTTLVLPPVGLAITAVAGTVALIGGIGLLRTKADLEKSEQNLSEKTRQLSELDLQSDHLHSIWGMLENACDRIPGICARLKDIGQFWAAIRTEAQTIHLLMESANTFHSQIGFRHRLSDQQVSDPYHNLERILHDYAGYLQGEQQTPAS